MAAIHAALLAAGQARDESASSKPAGEGVRSRSRGRTTETVLDGIGNLDILGTISLQQGIPSMSVAEMERKYTASERLFDEYVLKESSTRAGTVWKKRRLVLVRDVCFLICPEEQLVVDSIPTFEVAVVDRCVAKDAEPHSVIARGSMGGYCVRVLTIDNAFNAGAEFFFRGDRRDQAMLLVDQLQLAKDLAIQAATPRFPFLFAAGRVCRRLDSNVFWQWGVALLILCNFLTVCSETQVRPDASGAHIFYYVDIVFTIFFACELTVKMIAFLPKAFWRDPWNVFDLVVVSLSLAELVLRSFLELNQIRILRTFRAFRILRALGRFSYLKNTVYCFLSALPPIANALTVCLLVVLMMGTLAVDRYGELAPVEFGDLFRACYTLFVAEQFDEWPSSLLPLKTEQVTGVDVFTVLFLFAYYGIVSLVLMYVVQTALIEAFLIKFVGIREADKDRQTHHADGPGSKDWDPFHDSSVHKPLDPLFRVLSGHYETRQDFHLHLQGLFKVLDTDRDGNLTWIEINHGLRKLPVRPAIIFPANLFRLWKTELLGFPEDDESGLTEGEFETVMLLGLRDYVQRQLSAALQQEELSERYPLFSAFKILLERAKQPQRNSPLPSSRRPSVSISIGHAAGVEEGHRVFPQSSAGAHTDWKGTDKEQGAVLQSICNKAEAVAETIDTRFWQVCVFASCQLISLRVCTSKLTLNCGFSCLGSNSNFTWPQLNSKVLHCISLLLLFPQSRRLSFLSTFRLPLVSCSAKKWPCCIECKAAHV